MREKINGASWNSASNRHCFRARYNWNIQIFIGIAIEVIFKLLILARLWWAARAGNELTASEGGDPSGTYRKIGIRSQRAYAQASAVLDLWEMSILATSSL
jgi:hypothetical protein